MTHDMVGSMTEDRSERATAFGTVAADYDRYRPGPPPEAIEWLLPAGASTALDLAAGTGALSRLLVGRVSEVVAVELDPRMAAVLVRRAPGAAVVNGRAEAIPLRAASVDAVLVSSAWHWFDHQVAVPEIARVLRPGGVLGVIANGPFRSVGWVREVLQRGRSDSRGAGSVGPRDTAEAPDPGRDPVTTGRARHRVELPGGAPFSAPETTVIEWTLPRTPSELAGLAGTYSGVIIRPAAERLALARRTLHAVESHPLLRGKAVIDLPMACRCWKATRVG